MVDSKHTLTTREIEDLKESVPLLAANTQNMACEKLHKKTIAVKKTR